MKDEVAPNGDAKFQSIFAYAPLGMALVDADGHPVLNNKALRDILGYSEEELQNMAFTDFTHPEDINKDLDLYQQLMAGEIDSYKMEKRYIRKDGQQVWAQLTVSSIKGLNGKPEYAVGMVNDITETRALERQLAQAQKMDALGTLAGGIAHDFNNILAAISGHAELGLEYSEDSDLNEHLQTILKSADRASALIQQVLTFSAQDTTHLAPVDLHQVLKDGVRLITASIPKNIHIRWQFDVTRAPVNADVTQINQILVNLAVNAAHAIDGKQGDIEVLLKEEGNDFVFSLTDDGKGMSDETKQQMFDPFFTTKRIGKGAGLGLAVVDRMVRQHGGRIEVESAEGLGTSISVFIPRAVTEQTPAQPKKNIDVTLNGRVLVADDEPDLLRLYESILTELGLTVVCCNDGAEALDAFNQASQAFDLVITDQAMPRMTGQELTQEIRAQNQDIPILLTTGYSDVVNEEEASHIGAAGFFKKPFRRHTLKRIVAEILG